MDPSEYLVLLIDPSCTDTRTPSTRATPASPSGPALPISTRAAGLPSTRPIATRTAGPSSTLPISTRLTSQPTSSSASSTSSSSSNTQQALPSRNPALFTTSLHSPSKKNQRHPRSKSTSSSTSNSTSQSGDGQTHLPSILRLAGLKVLTTGTFEAALNLIENRPPSEARPMLVLVDIDSENGLTPPQSPAPLQDSTFLSVPYPNGRTRTNTASVSASDKDKTPGSPGQRHSRTTTMSPATRTDTRRGNDVNQENRVVTPGNSPQRGRRSNGPQTSTQNGKTRGSLGCMDFLDTLLQGLSKGSIRHLVPIAMTSNTSQARILEVFNMGVADVLIKPIEAQVARSLFLNVHRYSKYRTAVTIPKYSTQKTSLALPSHTRLRNVFLKDQWLSDILIHHYCPPPTKISISDFPSMSTVAAAERVSLLKERLLSWDFHPHDLCQDDLMRCVVIVIQEVMKLDGLGDLNIPEHLLHRFVIGLRDSYHRSNPYHNFAHAVDVLQATFYFLCRMGKLPLAGYGHPPLLNSNGKSAQSLESANTELKANIPKGDQAISVNNHQQPIRVQDFLRPEDIFALVVASIGHDVGHPGVNNMFLVNAHTPLAQVYNDRSVLESFHSMALFQVMKKHGFECFDVDSQNRKFMEFRKMVVSTILATDMGLHFDYVGKIKEQTERLRQRSTQTQEASAAKVNQASIDEQERLVLCGTLIKCADISNASRPFHVAERWSTVLLQEMCNQADIEKEMAVCSGAQPVPAGPAKNLANDCGMQIDSQLGFIHGFAMPLFSSVKDIIPEMGYCVDLLQINHKIWDERKTEYLKNGGGTFSLLTAAATAGTGTTTATGTGTSSPKKAASQQHHYGRMRQHSSKLAPPASPGRDNHAKANGGSIPARNSHS